ncbi:16S rRNA (uracil(1498)-N(3))-methyltransferase [Clostridium cylindrosporum]|uniref:Ribosomal RNA small subunit methyltransferase E n=1 Tax=Clostridium cylindrosporum DSM 605 TaxID=1121307 RepID=A0A0J8D6C6_CLOCY|nr:16S rRNA (uracil(1498)-N(3))-methyltransferase [Clostridium cylindrosporum]KMT21645.1 ribosomal RNA small subunit methyltransferase E [Clostridium cylindrosporum DSM 605]
MHKFFVPKENINDDNILITGDDVKHIGKVLRLKLNETINISDGSGVEYICSINTIDKKEVSCRIIEKFENATESPIKITLFQGLPKSQKMDLIVQKGVEIGISEVRAVITNRVVVKTEARDISNKIERWNKISKEAAKQSGRGVILDISEPVSFKDAIDSLDEFDLAVMPYENQEGVGLKRILTEKGSEAKNIAIFIGPEGGFEEEEVEYAKEKGVYPVTLGPRILRTETAGFVASTIILYELGDMGGIR